jgi:hypothetical protein
MEMMEESYRSDVQGGRRWRQSGVNCYLSAVIYFPSGNMCQISAVHDKVETTELIQPSMFQRVGAAASTTHGNQGNRASYFSPTREMCGQTLSTAGTCGRWAHHTSSPGRVRPFLQRMV